MASVTLITLLSPHVTVYTNHSGPDAGGGGREA